MSLPQKFEPTDLPFIQLESQETKKREGGRGLFQIFVEKLEPESEQQAEYDCYGLALNKAATVPWF